MRAVFLAIPAAVVLSACVEADMTIEILGEDQARVTGFMQMQRMMFDMSGGDESFCPPEDGGTLTLTETHARCDFDHTGSFDEIMSADADEDMPADLQGTITHLGGDRVRVLMPLGGMFEEMGDVEDDPQMLAMMKQMMAGMSITMQVKGRQIEESTGTISADGTRAYVTMDVDTILAPADQRLGDFDTTLRY